MTQTWAEVIATDTRVDLTVHRVVCIDGQAPNHDLAWRVALAVVSGVPADYLEVHRVIDLI